MRPRSPLLVLGATALLVAGCSVDSVVSVQPLSDTSVPGAPDTDSTAPGSSVPGSPGQTTPVQPVPTVGECHGPVTTAIIDAPSDMRPAVSCDGSHGLETFYVGQLPPEMDRWPGEALGGAVYAYVNQACAPALDAYLGTRPPGVPVPNRFNGFSFYFPSEDDWRAGARWFRCDAFVQPLSDREETVISGGTLRGANTHPIPPAYRVCETSDARFTGCDQTHKAEWVAAVDLRDIRAYPAEVADPVVTQRCAAAVHQALGLSRDRPDLMLGYQLPGRDAWEQSAAQRQATCVVAAADGRPLVGTLSGIGDTAPLPAAGTGAGA